MTQKEFISLIKKKREDNLIPQKDIARQIPISKSTYSKIENNKQNLTFFVIKRLSEIWNIDLNIIKDNPKKYHYMD